MATKKQLSRYDPASREFRKEEFPFYWIARVYGSYTQEMETALKAVGMDIPTWRVLFILKENGTSSISEISLHAIAKLSTVTKTVYRMKAEGLLDTAPSQQDGRVTEVTLTDTGRDAIERIQLATRHIFLRSFKGLTPSQIQKLNELLQGVLVNFEGH